MRKPWRYFIGLSLARILYPLTHGPIVKRSHTFFGDPMVLPLPSGLDIYLTGLKSHDSEIRLTRFLVQWTKPGMCVLDVGAHVGYYTLLMARCVGSEGTVTAFEPAYSSYSFLARNCAGVPRVTVTS
ncbi:MAG: FkbM family methyltransferase, partial [Saprospiraceae bacterium]|nr:FkbM family methyltransferase [Saprospiraceae bacterium]